MNTVKGGGVTLSRLFEGWPRERIAQVHADVLAPNTELCSQYYSVAGAFFKRPMDPATRRLSLFAGWLSRTGEHGLIWARYSRSLQSWISRFAPDVIFTQTGGPTFLRLAWETVRRTGARLVVHASDDWVSDWPSNVVRTRVPLISDHLAAMVDREFTRLVRRADVRMAISRRMALAYERRYGRPWLVFANPIDPHVFRVPMPRRDGVDGKTFELLYSGSVLPGSQLPGLIDIAKAVIGLHEQGEPVRLTIASDDTTVRYIPQREGVVEARPLVPADQLVPRLASADLLIMPMVFDLPMSRYYALSMPGKTAEYMASGTPTLVYAPRDCALVDYALDEDWAEVVSDRDPHELRSRISHLIREPQRRAALAARARSVGERDFDAARLRGDFQRAIIDAAAI